MHITTEAARRKLTTPLCYKTSMYPCLKKSPTIIIIIDCSIGFVVGWLVTTMYMTDCHFIFSSCFNVDGMYFNLLHWKVFPLGLSKLQCREHTYTMSFVSQLLLTKKGLLILSLSKYICIFYYFLGSNQYTSFKEPSESVKVGTQNIFVLQYIILLLCTIDSPTYFYSLKYYLAVRMPFLKLYYLAIRSQQNYWCHVFIDFFIHQ